MKFLPPEPGSGKNLAASADYRQFCSYGYHSAIEMRRLASKYAEHLDASSTEFKDWQRRVDALDAQFSSERDGSKLKKIVEIETYSDQVIGGGCFSHANWREEEADEVGYELYLKASLHAPTYGWNKIYMLKKQAPYPRAYEDCMDLLARNEVPERGAGIHPVLCYRYYNMHILEEQYHQADYEALLQKATMSSVPELSGRLTATQETLRR